jgi:hypothetical protein
MLSITALLKASAHKLSLKTLLTSIEATEVLSGEIRYCPDIRPHT